MKTCALCDVACELNRTHAVDFVAIMVGFKQELTTPTEAEAYAYLETHIEARLVEFFRSLRRKGALSDIDHRRHKDRCMWLLKQLSETASPMEYANALCEHIHELQKMLLNKNQNTK